ncbi:hypothetical protein PWP00_001452 [Enterococcus faecium]|nr:hypothetical protein [Enterococcus faecium]
MELTEVIALVEQRFKETNANMLNKKNSEELFSQFTNEDVPTIKMLNAFSEYRVKTRTGENNIEKLFIRKL